MSGDYNGDPLTPGLPATAGIYRRPVNESKLPSIPSQAISYGDAMELLRRLGGIKLANFIIDNPVVFQNCEVGVVGSNLSPIHFDEVLTLETSAFLITSRWSIYINNSVNKTKFSCLTVPLCLSSDDRVTGLCGCWAMGSPPVPRTSQGHGYLLKNRYMK